MAPEQPLLSSGLAQGKQKAWAAQEEEPLLLWLYRLGIAANVYSTVIALSWVCPGYFPQCLKTFVPENPKVIGSVFFVSGLVSSFLLVEIASRMFLPAICEDVMDDCEKDTEMEPPARFPCMHRMSLFAEARCSSLLAAALCNIILAVTYWQAIVYLDKALPLSSYPRAVRVLGIHSVSAGYGLLVFVFSALTFVLVKIIKWAC